MGSKEGAYWSVLGEVRDLLSAAESGDKEQDAALMVSLDKLTDIIKCGLDFTDKVGELLELLQIPLSLPNVVNHITVLFALCHVLHRAVELPNGKELIEKSHVMRSILEALGSEKREVRDAAGQALGAAGMTGAEVLLDDLRKTDIVAIPWERREGYALALGYIGGALKAAILGNAHGVHEMRVRLSDSLLPLLRLVSTENSAMAGDGAVLQHACRSVYWLLKDRIENSIADDAGDVVSKDVILELETLLCHGALEIRREAAIAVSVLNDPMTRILEHIDSFYELWKKENVGKQASTQDYLKLHGWLLVIRNYSERRAGDENLLSQKVIPFLERVIDNHVQLIEKCEKETLPKPPSEASFTAADALRAMANIINSLTVTRGEGGKEQDKKILLGHLFERIKKALSSSDTIIVDAALRTVQSLSKCQFEDTRERAEGDAMEQYLEEMIKSVIIWIYALQYHPAIVIKVASVDVLSTMSQRGLYNEYLGVNPEGLSSGELIKQMMGLIFPFLEESCALLGTTSSNDVRETITKASLTMLKKLVSTSERNNLRVQALIEGDEGKHALLEDFALLVIDKTLNGFVDKADGSFDFARPSASDCLEIFPSLLEHSVILDKLSDSELLVPLAFIPDEVSSGVVRLMGVLSETCADRVPFMGFLAIMLGIVSPIARTSLNTISVLPALSSLRSSYPELMSLTLVEEILHTIVPLALGDQSPLDEYLSACNPDYIFSPLDPFMLAPSLAIFKYTFLLTEEQKFAEACYSVAVTAVLTALTDGSDEFRAKEFAAAILYETDLEGLYKHNNRWGDLIGLFLARLEVSGEENISIDLFPDSGEIETTIDNVADVCGEAEITGKYRGMHQKYMSIGTASQEMSEAEQLVWSIINKKPVILEHFTIYSSLVEVCPVITTGEHASSTESMKTVYDAIQFLKMHRGQIISTEELSHVSKIIMDEDVSDEDRLELLPVLLKTNAGFKKDTFKFPCLPIDIQVLGEGKKNEGFASDSQFAAMK